MKLARSAALFRPLGWLLFGFCLCRGVLPAEGASSHDPENGLDSNLSCRRVVLRGEVEAGKTWKAEIGQGWVFEVVPIAGVDYSGWDLVIDRIGAESGYPDALLLATPPYGSLNEREIGTTFGLRAQDAVGWEPRKFHYLTSYADLGEARKWFTILTHGGQQSAAKQTASAALMQLIGRAAMGEFQITDAKLIPGQADALGFGQQWGANLSNVPHTVIQEEKLGLKDRRCGKIRWIRFEVRLWLPARWGVAPGMRSELVKCAQ